MSAPPLTDAEYHQRASAALAAIESQVDRWLDEDVIDIDSHRTGGLLELAFPDASKIIINTQAAAAGVVAGGARWWFPLPLRQWPVAGHPRRRRLF